MEFRPNRPAVAVSVTASHTGILDLKPMPWIECYERWHSSLPAKSLNRAKKEEEVNQEGVSSKLRIHAIYDPGTNAVDVRWVGLEEVEYKKLWNRLILARWLRLIVSLLILLVSIFNSNGMRLNINLGRFRNTFLSLFPLTLQEVFLSHNVSGWNYTHDNVESVTSNLSDPESYLFDVNIGHFCIFLRCHPFLPSPIKLLGVSYIHCVYS